MLVRMLGATRSQRRSTLSRSSASRTPRPASSSPTLATSAVRARRAAAEDRGGPGGRRQGRLRHVRRGDGEREMELAAAGRTQDQGGQLVEGEAAAKGQEGAG